MQIDRTSFDYTSTSVKLTVQSGANAPAGHSSASQSPAKAETDAYLPSAGASTGLSVVEQMKADLAAQQQRLFDLVNDMLSKQGMQVTVGQGIWKTLSGGSFKVDAQTQAAAQASIADGGYWGVPQTSRRIVDFAKALTNGDPSQVGLMREAFIKGYKAAGGAWGGALPGIAQDTYDEVMRLFDEWENGASEGAESAEAPAQSAGSSSGSVSVSMEYERTVVSASSVSVTTGSRDAGDLTRSGILSDVSEPMKFHGTTLNAAWCMNEKVTVTVTVGGGQSSSRSLPGHGHDGFVPAPDHGYGGYGRDGKRMDHDRGHVHGHDDHSHHGGSREMELIFYKPMHLDDGRHPHSVRVGGQDIPLHEDGTVTVGLPDGTLRRAKVDQDALDRAAHRHHV